METGVKKFYCNYAEGVSGGIKSIAIQARRSLLANIFRSLGWETGLQARAIHWMDFIHYVSVEVPDQRDRLVQMTVVDGPFAKEGFHFMWGGIFGDRISEDDRNSCDGCNRPSYDSLEENDLFLKYENENQLAACPYVAVVCSVYENSRWGGVLPYWKDSVRSFWRAESLAGYRFTLLCEKPAPGHGYCEMCIANMIEVGDLVLVSDVCSGCGDYHTPVTCQLCQSEHDCAIPFKKEPLTQGDNCASHTFEHNAKWFMGCGYGSEYDMDIFEIIDSSLMKDLNPICDVCITKLVDEKKLVFVSDHAIDWGESVGMHSDVMSMKKYAQEQPEAFAKMIEDARYRSIGYHSEEE